MTRVVRFPTTFVSTVLSAMLAAACSSVPVDSGGLPSEPPAQHQPTSQPPAGGPVYVEVFVDFLGFVGDTAPADGGSVGVVPADSAGAQPRTVAVVYVFDVGYLGQIWVSPGRYTLTYTPPEGYRIASGESPQTVTVNSSTQVQFAISP